MASMWGLEELPTIVTAARLGRAIPSANMSATVGRRTPYPVKANVAELAALMGISAGQGAFNGNGVDNAISNGLAVFGHNPIVKLGLNGIGEALEQ